MASYKMDCSRAVALDHQAAQSMMGSSNETEADLVVAEIPSVINTREGQQ